MKTEKTISRFLLLLAVGLLFAVQSFAQGGGNNSEGRCERCYG